MKNADDVSKIARSIVILLAIFCTVVIVMLFISSRIAFKAENVINVSENMNQEPRTTENGIEPAENVETEIGNITKTKPVTPNQSATDISNIFVTTDGCGSINLHKINAGNNRALSVSISADALDLNETPQTFDLAQSNENVTVTLVEGENLSEEYCNDVVNNGNIVTKESQAVRGSITVSVSGFDKTKPNWDRSYTATVLLYDVYFAEQNGEIDDEYIKATEFNNVSVGWLPG